MWLEWTPAHKKWPAYALSNLVTVSYSAINKKKATSKLWLPRHLTHDCKASAGKDEENWGEGGQRGGRRRAVESIKQRGCWGWGVWQSCSALHTPESTGSWMRLSWACNSSRLDTSYSGSVWRSRTGEREAHTGKEAQRWERWKTQQ